MSETKYHFRREGNHFKLSSSQNRSEQAERPTPVQPIAPKRVKRSIWSSIGSFFGILFSGIVMILGFLIATPFFLLSVLWNWVITFIGLSIFWIFVGVIYYGMILGMEMDTNLIFNNTSIPILLIVSLLGAILLTIAQIRE
ncbi:lactose transporter [Streptococcus agalactiae]|nr:lactose transporter [Streptococcus agalactiae]